MRTIDTVAALRSALAPPRLEGRSIGLVPTMGAFHDGHVSLMRRARAECDVVVVSLFVNPSQFAAGEDLDRYPRDPDRDAAFAQAAGVDVLFAPPFDQIYPAGFSTSVEVAGLSDRLCGAPGRRGAGHFRGVATVVAKLLNLAQPDVAYFGAKDYQQALVVERLARDLDIPVEIRICPTVRDPDGLALSSRNAYLSAEERRRALALNRALESGHALIEAGEQDPGVVAKSVARDLVDADVEIEYVEVVSASDLSPLERIDAGERVLIALAAHIGQARLIDNLVIQGPKSKEHVEPGPRPGERVRA
jgi:pantoate--beta-alanine ligase